LESLRLKFRGFELVLTYCGGESVKCRKADQFGQSSYSEITNIHEVP